MDLVSAIGGEQSVKQLCRDDSFLYDEIRPNNECEGPIYNEQATIAKGAYYDTSNAAAYPFDTTDALLNLIEEFRDKRDSIPVSFREMVPWIKGERATHYIHSYPAKLLPQIAHFFLSANGFFGRDEVVLDPFSGSGTVVLEALLSGRRAFWSDVNPLARLITNVKTHYIDVYEAEKAFARVTRRFKRRSVTDSPDVVNIELWYDTRTISQLARLKRSIELEANSIVKDLLWTTFSTVARSSSRADPRFSVPVRRKAGASFRGKPMLADPDVWKLFEDQFKANCYRHNNLQELCSSLPPTTCVGNDARYLQHPSTGRNSSSLPDGSVGLIITSPPYAGAQKYIRSSSLSLGWLGLASPTELRSLESKSIGREKFPKVKTECLLSTNVPEADVVIRRVFEKNKTRASIASHYIIEMQQTLQELCRVLRPEGHLILVIGDNQICGETFESNIYLSSIAESAGLELQLKLVDTIKGRGLLTKRHTTASVITREWILLFRKRS